MLDATLHETSPLTGWRVAITRPWPAGSALRESLVALGAECLVTPLLEVAPPDDTEALRAALRRIDEYDWIVFTSANAVRAVVSVLDRPLRGQARTKPRVAAVGRATAAALAASGNPVDFVPDRFDGETLAASLELTLGMQILLPRSAIATETVAHALAARGSRVDAVIAYNVEVGRGSELLETALGARAVDCLTVFSPSAVRVLSWVTAAVPGPVPPVVAVGPVTAKAATEAGFPVAATSQRFDDGGVIAQLVELAKAGRRS